MTFLAVSLARLLVQAKLTTASDIVGSTLIELNELVAVVDKLENAGLRPSQSLKQVGLAVWSKGMPAL